MPWKIALAGNKSFDPWLIGSSLHFLIYNIQSDVWGDCILQRIWEFEMLLTFYHTNKWIKHLQNHKKGIVEQNKLNEKT